MFSKYLLTIYFLILIAIFVYLFQLSIPSIEKEEFLDKTEEILAVRTKRFLGLLTQEEKEDLSRYPCTKQDRNKSHCRRAKALEVKFSSFLKGGAIEYSTLVNSDGKNLFRDRPMEVFGNLLPQADNKGMAHSYMEIDSPEMEESLIPNLTKLQIYTNDSELKGIYVASLVKASEVPMLIFPLYFGLITLFLGPLDIIALFIVRGRRLWKSKERNFSNKTEGLEKNIEKLKHENVQQSQFLANFTHELRTPLNSIIGFSGLIKDETLGPLGNMEYSKYASDINNSGIHLLSLINDILDYSKAEVGRLNVNMDDCDIIKVIKQSFSIVAPRANESGVELLQSFSTKHCILKIDQKRFKQVLLNLLSNAVKFTDSGGSVTVSVFTDIKQTRLYVEVKDTGVGIEEKDIPTVMSLFGQVETDLNRNYEGTGIGLPFAKKLTNLLGGTFELSSKVGLGTRITLGFQYNKALNAEFEDNFRV